jgi:predicted Ser/Thr protein kinase
MKLYSSKKTSVNLVDGKVIKIIKKPTNEKEYEIQTIASKLDIAPVVYGYNFDNIEKILTIEMEYIEGIMLDDYLKLPKIEKKRVRHSLFETLNKLYDNGIDYKDLCGENILVVSTDKKINIKILDYGDAKLHGETLPYRSRDYSCLNNRNWN